MKHRLLISIIAAALLSAVNLYSDVLSQRPFAGKLYSSLFYDFLPKDDVANIKTANLPEELKRRLEEYKNRRLGFRTRSGGCRALPRDLVPICDARRVVEKGIVSLINSKGIEKAAADYARNAVLYYEWEGFADGQLDEARDAEEYLRRRPATMLKPYLILFLTHRYRCAYEYLEFEKKFDEQKAVSEKYRHYLREAREYSDRLVSLMAEDLDAEPYLYIKTNDH